MQVKKRNTFKSIQWQAFNLLVLFVSVIMLNKYLMLWLLAFSVSSVIIIICSPNRWLNLMLGLVGCGLIVSLWRFIPANWTLKHASELLNENMQQFSLRSIMQTKVNQLYSPPYSIFLNIFLFNEKVYNNEQYKLFRDLGMLHLFVVSGLHINVMCWCFYKLFKRCHWLAITTNLLLCLVMFYLANFSISILRIIINLLISQMRFFKRQSSFEKNCWVGILLCLFIRDASGFSFLLTMICTLAINLIVMIFTHSMSRLFYINFCLFFVSLPITIHFNGYFNIVALLNGFAYSYVFLGMFYYALCTSWFMELVWVNTQIWNFIFLYFERLLWLQYLTPVKINNWVIALVYFLEYLGVNYYFYKLKIHKQFWINYNKQYAENY